MDQRLKARQTLGAETVWGASRFPSRGIMKDFRAALPTLNFNRKLVRKVDADG